MNNLESIAHVRKNEDGSWANPQPFINHLEGSAAKLASRFAEAFNSASWAYAAGFTHDIGKAAYGKGVIDLITIN